MILFKHWYSTISLIAMAGALAACGPLTTVPVSPGAVANATTLDERAAIAVESAYLGAGALVEAATDAGLIKGALAVRVDALDALAASWINLARRAYDAGNAASYAQALDEAKAAIAELTQLTHRVQPKSPGAGEVP